MVSGKNSLHLTIKLNKKFTYTFFICCCISLYGCRLKQRLPSLRETYSYKDTKPFGAYTAKKILDNCFPGNYVQTVKEPFAKTAAIFDDSSSVYFCVSRNLFLGEKDVDAILNFVYNGNSAFFATSNFDSLLLNRIFCEVDSAASFTGYRAGEYEQTSVRLMEGINADKDSFGYFYRPFRSYFSVMNDRYSRVIGYNALGEPNCIVFFWGKGKLFLHTDPRVFSNYFLLTQNNNKYMQRLMQVQGQDPQHVFWDDYYNKINSRRSQGNSSSLSEIFKYPPLQTAFWLLLSMLLLYILFEGKRRQRMIREIKPNENSSVAFTETIARLYLQKHDNKNIADKMITYFYEFIRNNYFLNANTGNKDFIIALSKKSGVSEEMTIALFNAISQANKSSTIDDFQLLSLNGQIQQFYKKRK